MTDVMVKPDNDDAAFAAETKLVGKYYYYLPPDKKAAARDTLRHLTRADFYRKEDGMADIILEQIWNQLVGNF